MKEKRRKEKFDKKCWNENVERKLAKYKNVEKIYQKWLMGSVRKLVYKNQNWTQTYKYPIKT